MVGSFSLSLLLCKKKRKEKIFPLTLDKNPYVFNNIRENAYAICVLGFNISFVDLKRILILLDNVFHREMFKYCVPDTRTYESD